MKYRTDYDFAFLLGYEIGNQDPYAKRRGTELHGLSFGDEMPAKEAVYHQLFVGITCYF